MGELSQPVQANDLYQVRSAGKDQGGAQRVQYPGSADQADPQARQTHGARILPRFLGREKRCRARDGRGSLHLPDNRTGIRKIQDHDFNQMSVQGQIRQVGSNGKQPIAIIPYF